ncbi:MAG: aldehyde dehydrogenase family protein [Lentisphaerae bacterium]|nr:aldehyde dehydrogenase family protein [Lentisphaerota bacterium]
MAKTYRNYINGNWAGAKTGKTFASYNPAKKHECVGEFQASEEADVYDAVIAAELAYQGWRREKAKRRIESVEKFLANMESHRKEFSEIITREQGKTLKESDGEINSSVTEGQHTVRRYASLASDAADGEFAGALEMTSIEPLGVVSIITPWNYPVNTFCRKTLPALISGNTVVAKPASFTPLCGIYLAQLVEKSGFPTGVFNCITGQGGGLGNCLVAHPAVKAVSFTGSTAVGRKINEIAASTFTRTQLELGGKNALIVDESANLEEAAKAVVTAGFGCAGQWCVSTSRVLAQKNIAAAFTEILLRKIAGLRIGDPMLPETDIGPVAGESQYRNILKYIDIAKAEGCELLCGGGPVNGLSDEGYFIHPTVFNNVAPDKTIFREEVFGPVVGITAYGDFDEALQLANDSEYGLSSSLYTNDISHALKYSQTVETGMAHINVHTGYKDPRFPFGGWKNSGNGRPENGKYGIEFFTETKAVYWHGM